VSTHKRPSLVDVVRHGLLDDLMNGTLEPGAKLPNENELADRFSVSRATVREAVLLLEQAGYLSRRHGSGTYVTNAPRSRHALDTTVSYTAMIRDAGHEPSETVLEKLLRIADEPERGLLGLVHGEHVVEIERVRLADGRPVIYSVDRIPEALLGELATEALDSSLYLILSSVGHAVVRATAELLPTLADAKLARLLEVKRGSPLLHIDQVDYDARGRPVMLSQEWHVPDAFEVIVNRRSSPIADDAERDMSAAVSAS
jgi:DNA-binding GntR family transcriptional regulator